MGERMITLSPSRLELFRQCPQRFKFRAIDRIPDEPGVESLRGTLVHSTLERLMALPSSERGRNAVPSAFEGASRVIVHSDEFQALRMESDSLCQFLDEARGLVENYFQLEDPTRIHPVGIELKLQATIGGATVRGVIDRLDWTPDGFEVVDYKTGRVPSERYERKALAQLMVYAAMVKQTFGVAPRKVTLLYLREPLALSAKVTDQGLRGIERTVGAVNAAVERAVDTGDFPPVKSKLCGWCSYREICPAWS